jgi:hypothetical protein
MKRLTSFYDELVLDLYQEFHEFLGTRKGQICLHIAIWTVSVVDYPAATTLSRLIQPQQTTTV